MGRTATWFPPPAWGLLAWLCCCCCLLSAPGPAEGGRVLVMPVDGSSWLSMKLLVKELAERGHEVLVLVPETSLLIGGSANYRTESFPVPYKKEDLDSTLSNLNPFVKTAGFLDVYVNLQRLMNFTSLQVVGCESLLYNEELMGRLRGSYDLVLTDPFLPCGGILAETFQIPAVYFLRGLPCGLDTTAAQCPSPPSYVPIFHTDNTDRMNFPQRVKNVLMYMVESFLCRIMYASFDELAGRYLGEGMTYRDVLGHGAIWLLRYDFTFEWPKPIMPNMVHIGGINCAGREPLPADVEEFVEGSGKDGFIVFTLGSMISAMPPERAKVFFDAFRMIPQRVLWRYTGPVPEDAPKNVKLMKWLPQNDLLGHPKAKAFLTHGGMHGIYEGICNAVPMVMMPLFGDQADNVHRMVSRGVAEKVSPVDVTSEELVALLKKVIGDKGYQERMNTLSSLHLDRPVEPLDLAIFWTEFVLRHNGAEHLKPGALHLNWIQYHSLDVMGLLLLVAATVLLVTLKCCLFCGRRCYAKVTAGKRKTE